MRAKQVPKSDFRLKKTGSWTKSSAASSYKESKYIKDTGSDVEKDELMTTGFFSRVLCS